MLRVSFRASTVGACASKILCSHYISAGDVFITQLLSNVSYLFAWQASAYLPQYFEDPYTHFDNYSKNWELCDYNLAAMQHTFEGRKWCHAGMDDKNIKDHIALYYGKILTHQMLGFLKSPEPAQSLALNAKTSTTHNILCDSLDHRRLEFFTGSSDPIVQACKRAGRPVAWTYGSQQVTEAPTDSAFPISDENGTFTMDHDAYLNATSALFAFQTLAGMQYAAQVVNLCNAEDTWRSFNGSLILRADVVQDVMCTPAHRMDLITADDLLAEMIDNMSKMLAFQLFYASGSKAWLEYLCEESSPGVMAHLDTEAMNGMFMDPDLITKYVLSRCKTSEYCKYECRAARESLCFDFDDNRYDRWLRSLNVEQLREEFEEFYDTITYGLFEGNTSLQT